MGIVKLDEAYLTNIGNAIRGRTGGSSLITPANMANAVTNIPNAYAAGDEGKVVKNGALAAQTARTVTENGTYDTTENNAVTVNVSGGGGSAIVLSGTDEPSASLGEDGNIYIQYDEIPSKYTVLEYLAVESAGPYIDTDVVNTQNAYYEIAAQYTATPGNNNGYFGAQTTTEYTVNYYGGVFFIVAGAGRTVIPASEVLLKHKIAVMASSVSVDDGAITGAVNWNKATGRNYFMFAVNYSGGVLKAANARIWYCKIWNGDNLVRYMIPVRQNADNALGMYDAVSKRFFTNAGTGSFVAGSDVAGGFDGNGIIRMAYAKVNGKWQDLYGSDINDIG